MKFLCQRCQTRYSIADERVRGKILKIRCKTCAEIITVREGMAAVPPRSAAPRRTRAATQAAPEPLSGNRVSGSAQAVPPPRPQTRTRQPRPSQNPALRGAFEQALASSPAQAPPAALEPDWYLAENGVQSGPFSLARAKAKLRERGPAEELYCWSEGFDAWLPVAKVSHFRGVFDGAVGKAAATFEDDDATVVEPGFADPLVALTHQQPPPREVTPKPLFASTWAQLAAEGQKNGTARSPDGDRSDPIGDLQLDIGEASRVVKLSMLASPSGAGAVAAPAGLPGMAGPAPQPAQPFAATGGAAVAAPTLAPLAPAGPQRRRRVGVLLPFVAGGCVLVLVISVLIYLLGPGAKDKKTVRARSDLADETLGYSFEHDDQKPGPATDNTTEPDKATTESHKPHHTGGTTHPSTTANQHRPQNGKSEVRLSGGGDAVGSRVPSDITAEYQKNTFPIQHCHEVALKRNPFLDVRKASVDITVAPSGKVSTVKIPSLEGTVLGRCIETRIRAWRLGPAKNELTTRLTLLFARR